MGAEKDRERADDPVLYVCIDCEASGPVPGLYNLVSLGAVPVIEEPAGHRVLDDQLYLELKPAFPGFDPEAMAIHGIKREDLEARGKEPRQAMEELRNWALGLRRGSEHLVFVGHNAPFDWMYVSYYFTWTGIPNPFGYKALDTKALAMGRLGIRWLATNKDVIEKHLPAIGRENRKLKHRADYDARYQARILAALLDHRPKPDARPGGA